MILAVEKYGAIKAPYVWKSRNIFVIYFRKIAYFRKMCYYFLKTADLGGSYARSRIKRTHYENFKKKD